MPKKSAQPKTAKFLQCMECLPVPRVPEGPQWSFEILCGPPHNAERF
jgi:hypothetical protein